MNYYFNPLDETCKSITGAIPRNQKITFHIEETEGGVTELWGRREESTSRDWKDRCKRSTSTSGKSGV